MEVLRAGATRRVRQAEDLLNSTRRSRTKLDADHERLQDERFAGELDNDDWQDWKVKYAEDAPTLDAQIERFTENLKRTQAEAKIADVEEAVIECLSAIRGAASGITSAGDAQAMRAALLRLFTEFRLEPDAGVIQADLWLPQTGRKLVPVVNPAVFQGWVSELRIHPVLTRTTVDLVKSSGKDRDDPTAEISALFA